MIKLWDDLDMEAAKALAFADGVEVVDDVEALAHDLSQFAVGLLQGVFPRKAAAISVAMHMVRHLVSRRLQVDGAVVGDGKKIREAFELASQQNPERNSEVLEELLRPILRRSPKWIKKGLFDRLFGRRRGKRRD